MSMGPPRGDFSVPQHNERCQFPQNWTQCHPNPLPPLPSNHEWPRFTDNHCRMLTNGKSLSPRPVYAFSILFLPSLSVLFNFRSKNDARNNTPLPSHPRMASKFVEKERMNCGNVYYKGPFVAFPASILLSPYVSFIFRFNNDAE